MGLFKNGNRRVTRLVIWELGTGCLLMCIMQIQGMIPSQDWISATSAKKIAFALALMGTLLKAAEMFFSKTATMFKNHELSDDDGYVPIREVESSPFTGPMPPPFDAKAVRPDKSDPAKL